MKKIISAITAAAMSVSCAAAVSAARMQDISESLARDEIHIIYNDKAVEYVDAKPINTEDRVMIPFRAALETMNAKVDYDDATRVVTASKGGKTINFTLLDDTIYIDDNGEKSTITMDVPMIVRDDRTYVPVRFMSNALGMQVGWDGDSGTVVIMDYDEYLEKINESIPNITKLASYKTTNLNKCGVTLNMNKTVQGENALSIEAVLNMLLKDGKTGMNGTLKLTSPTINIDDSDTEMVLDGTTLYFRTNLLNNLTKDNDLLTAVASALTGGGEWCSVDLEQAGVSVVALHALEMAASGQIIDVNSYLTPYITKEGDVPYSTTIKLAALADMFEVINKNLVVEEKEDGYKLSLKITPKEFREILGMTESEGELSADMNVDVTSTKSTADVEVSLVVDDQNSVTLKLNEVAEIAGEDEKVTVPESGKDMTSILANPLAALTLGQ